MVLRRPRRRLPLLVALLGLLTGCNDGTGEGAAEGTMLVAKRIQTPDEMIGGPSARGKIGDYLIQNDEVRFVIAGLGQAWAGGVFGGTLLDADRVRQRSDVRYGEGWDSFGESFPLVNLIVTNPNQPGRKVSFTDQGPALLDVPSTIEVVKDGSDGEAMVRVSGRGGYIFELLKILSRGFLESYLTLTIGDLIPSIPLPNQIDWFLDQLLHVNVYMLLNRLQIDFQYFNDYVLRAGQKYLTLKTTIVTSPPSESVLANCPQTTCELECEHGYALEEVDFELVDNELTDGKLMCPVCACADGPQEMATLNESEDIFRIILGGLEAWRDPAWKGGLLGGDFLFFGKEANVFAPGLGYDESRRIFENMWQNVPSLASPLTFDWLAATAPNVSYGWVTRNSPPVADVDCVSYRLAITFMTYDFEDEVMATLMDRLGYSDRAAAAMARQVIVDQRPIVLASVDIDPDAATPEEIAAWKQATIDTTTVPAVPEGGGDAVETLVTELFPQVQLGVIPPLECNSSKLVIPIFSSSATAVMTHKSPSQLEIVDGRPRDTARTFHFERYFVVGDGDVGSVLETVYELKGVEHGTVGGVVMDEGTATPVRHASVLAVRDPRTDPNDPAPETYDELIAQTTQVFGREAIVSQMETDLGLDEVHDGDYRGPLAPGRYFLVAFTKERGVSRPVGVTVEAGKRAVAHLMIPQKGQVHFHVQGVGGQRLPCRLSFQRLDADGRPMKWDATTRPELGGSRHEDGILKQHHSHEGEGIVSLPAGKYDVYVSRGFEYSLDVKRGFEVLAGQTVTLHSLLYHEIDTSGWVSGDFHVHARPSIDAGLPLDERLESYVSEGVELLASTDHDFLTNYQPVVNELELEPFIRTMVGVETSTLEFGHYNGFPMRYDDTDLPVHDTPPWYGMGLDRVFEEMRARYEPAYGEDNFVVQVNHPRDGMMGYLAQIGLRGWDLQRSTSALSMCNPQTEVAPCNFDAMELMNEKRFELMRTPTIADQNRHNTCLQRIFEEADQALFSVANGADVAAAVCGDLQQDPHPNCDTIDADIAAATYADGDWLAEIRDLSVRDHCQWHDEFIEMMAECTPESSLVFCKKQALDALKLLNVRYQLERLPEEQEAFFSLSGEAPAGCSYEDAMKGCAANLDADSNPLPGCAEGDCLCEDCVCAAHPECCEAVADGGTGWTEACAGWCASECHGCGVQPCDSHQQVFEDWFAFLNVGFNITGVGNSDSHDTLKEGGLPRTYVASRTDDPQSLDMPEVLRNFKAHRAVVSAGPFIRFSIGGAGIGDTLRSPGDGPLRLEIQVQTASWFGIDHIEIYRNAKLERIIRVDTAKEAIIDFDQVVELERPDEDSWYVVLAVGLDRDNLLNPVYKKAPFGQLLIPSILSMGIQSILISFQDLLDELEQLALPIDALLGDLIGLNELPDSFPMFPFAVTNPIWVDLDGDGFTPVNAVDADGDGVWDLPPFCSRPCEVEPIVDDQGNPAYGASDCGENQTCVPSSGADAMGLCKIPIPDNCIGWQSAPPGGE